MSYLVTLDADQVIQELFHTDISPSEIIPPDAIEISNSDGEVLRQCNCFASYRLVNGAIEPS